MAIIKCKMCGGDLNLVEGQSVAECEYCGSRQTVPAADNEKKLTLFARANRLRAACEFDKAAGIYETIVADYPEEAESYWGLVLCKYGIEYVDDPATGKKIPTCHRSSFDSILEDSDFEQAMENADVVARRVYREEAKYIEQIRRGILAVSSNEQPYDIFICYKETDEHGNRTLDSVLAQDIYDALTEKGYRTFFARITLEDKLGQEYEPYIFAALNSARIMLAVGTDYEYFNAVWVKNEWSRYLKLMTRDKDKHLIPCYKNLDAYDMPREFAKLQAQDLGKLGAMQDLLRGIGKILGTDSAAKTAQEKEEPASAGPSGNYDISLKRGIIAVEDGEWDRAAEFFEEVLNHNPDCGEVHLGRALIAERANNLDMLVRKRLSITPEIKVITFGPEKAHIEEAVRNLTVQGYLSAERVRGSYNFTVCYESQEEFWREQLRNENRWWMENTLLVRAEKYGNEQTRQNLARAKETIFTELERRRLEAEGARQRDEANARTVLAQRIANADRKIAAEAEKTRKEREERYNFLVQRAKDSMNEIELKSIQKELLAMGDYRDAPAMARLCEKAELIERYEALKKQVNSLLQDVEQIKAVKRELEAMRDFRDAPALVQRCENQIELREEENSTSHKLINFISAGVLGAIAVAFFVLCAVAIFSWL